MTSSDDDFLATGYDPSEVIGYDDRHEASSLGEAVPKVTAGIYREDRTGNLADVAEEELDAVAQGFRDRKDREAERYELATNSDYWLCLCFATQAQRDAFLAETGWRDLGYRYLDGRALANRMGVDLPPDPDWPNSKRDTSWDGFAMTVEDNRAVERRE
jgi:hypothetical protein